MQNSKCKIGLTLVEKKNPANCALTEFSSSRLGKVSKLPLLALAASVAAFLRNFFGKSCKENL